MGVNEIYEALDIEAPGANEQEVAEPENLEGANEQEAAEPAEEEALEEVQEVEQTKEERAKFAAQRRKAELEEAVNAAVKKANEENQAKWDRFFKEAQIPNPAKEGTTLQSMDDFEEYLKWRDAASIADKAQKGEVTEEEIRATIDRRAEQRARELAQQYARDRMDSEARVRDQIAKIREIDPSINSVEDLLSMPNASQFRQYVERGNNFVDAFYLANRDSIEQKKADLAAQHAVNSARSKDHLTSTKTKGGGEMVDVPASELALFREFMPDASASEIKAYYNKYVNK